MNLHAIELGTLNAALFEYELPLKRPLVTGSGTIRSRRGTLLQLSVGRPNAERGGSTPSAILEGAGAGAVGWGEAAPLPGHSTEELAGAIACLEEWLSVESFDGSLHALLTRARTCLKHSPCAWAAAGGALADLASKQLGIPLFEFLRRASPRPPAAPASGAPAPGAPASGHDGTSSATRQPSSRPPAAPPSGASGASGAPGAPASPLSVPTAVLLDGESAEAVAREARRAHSAGYTTFKLKAGFNPFEHDLERVGALRSAVGSSANIRIDINGAWSPAEALPRLEALAEYRPEFVEEPCRGLEEIRLLQADSPVPLAVDESLPPLSDLLGLGRSQTGAATLPPAPSASSALGAPSAPSASSLPPITPPLPPAHRPLPEHDHLRSQTGAPSTPSASGNSEDCAGLDLDLGDLTADLTDLGVDTAVLKPSVLGAVTELSVVAAALHAAGTKVVISSSLESAVGLTTALHLAAALGNGSGTAVGLGTSDLLAADLCEPPLSANGSLVVPSGPGIGVDPDRETAPMRRLRLRGRGRGRGLRGRLRRGLRRGRQLRLSSQQTSTLAAER